MSDDKSTETYRKILGEKKPDITPGQLGAIRANLDAMQALREAEFSIPEGLSPAAWAEAAESYLARAHRAPKNEMIALALALPFNEYALALEQYIRQCISAQIRAMPVMVVINGEPNATAAVDLRDEIAKAVLTPRVLPGK